MAEVIYKGFTVRDDGTVFNKFGKKVGSHDVRGYISMSLEGKPYYQHRFIWEAFNGEIPDGFEIDHINTIRDDNRLVNLRVLTKKQNRNNPLTIEHYKIANKRKGATMPYYQRMIHSMIGNFMMIMMNYHKKIRLMRK